MLEIFFEKKKIVYEFFSTFSISIFLHFDLINLYVISFFNKTNLTKTLILFFKLVPFRIFEKEISDNFGIVRCNWYRLFLLFRNTSNPIRNTKLQIVAFHLNRKCYFEIY